MDNIVARWRNPRSFKTYMKDSIDLFFLGLWVDILIRGIWRVLKQ